MFFFSIPSIFLRLLKLNSLLNFKAKSLTSETFSFMPYSRKMNQEPLLINELLLF